MGKLKEQLKEIEKSWADDDGPAHADIKRLLEVVRVQNEALKKALLYSGNVDAGHGCRLIQKESNSALTKAEEIMSGGE